MVENPSHGFRKLISTFPVVAIVSHVIAFSSRPWNVAFCLKYIDHELQYLTFLRAFDYILTKTVL